MTVPSMLSGNDVNTLISIMEFISSQGDYQYLEIGSYLGASLQWHLTNNKCIKAVSIDKRSTAKILDERHIDLAYNVSTQDMINTLQSNRLPVNKLVTIDGTVDDIVDHRDFDLVFIDAEHTNSAVFYDGTRCISVMKENSVLMFHDDWIVYKGIERLEEQLISLSKTFRKFKMPGCDITAIVFGNLIDSFQSRFGERSVPWNQLVEVAERKLVRDIQRNQGNR
jgi:predicted O-methyltransferase YrrM